MKITQEEIKLSENKSIKWGTVSTLKLLNDKLQFVLKDSSIVEIGQLNQKNIDDAFSAYSNFLRMKEEGGTKGKEVF